MNGRFILGSVIVFLSMFGLSAGVNPSFGTRVWDIVVRDLEIDTSILSKVDTIESTVAVIEGLEQSILSKVCVVDSKTDIIDSKIDKIITDLICTPTPVTTVATISSPGSYCLADNIAGIITIDSPQVVLDLNGHKIIGGIALTGSASEIFIMNGFIDGGGATIGIDISTAAVSDVHIINMTIRGATGGIAVTVAVSRLFISDTIVNGSASSNLSLTGADNVFIKNSVFNASLGSTGASFFGCTQVEIRDCFFNLNMGEGLLFTAGSTNIRVIGCSLDGNAMGTMLSGGSCYEFIECHAETNVVGFSFFGANIVCEACFACSNSIFGFTIGPASNICIDRCIAKSNAGDGFVFASGSSGVVKENLAVGNLACGFNDITGAATGIAYLANTAQSNAGGIGAGNYCIGGAPVALGTPPFSQFTSPGVPSFWDNVSV